MKSKDLLKDVSKGLSVSVIVFWLIFLLMTDLGKYNRAGFMVWALLFIITFLAWRRPLYGGLAYILVGLLYLILVSGFSGVNLMVVAPFLVMGGIFVGRYFYDNFN
tara:strand:+ start:532 stop:849 length:318 start_codon:yes stop_codon:yes gene_type:complete